MARVAIVGFALLLAYECWSYVTVHTRGVAPLAMACRYLESCEVCLNKGGVPVCGEASYIDKDTALRVAWFRACMKALPHPNTSREIAALDGVLDSVESACESRMDGLWTPVDEGSVHGFLTATEAERRCVGWDAVRLQRIEANLDGYVTEPLKSSSNRVRTVEHVVSAQSRLMGLQKKVNQEVWRECIKELPRYSVACTPASDAVHVESAEALVPPEVLSFGR